MNTSAPGVQVPGAANKEETSTVNLYAIVPTYAPNSKVSFMLAEDDAEALDQGVFLP